MSRQRLYRIVFLSLCLGLILAGVLARQVPSLFASRISGEALKTLARGFDDFDRLKPDGDILSPFMVVRPSGSPSNAAVQKHLVKTFKDLGWHVEEDPFVDNTPIGEIAFNNIIVTKNPSAEKRLVLAAHFDSKLFHDFEFVGATDSAVPCAILVDVAMSLNRLLDEASDSYGGKLSTTTLQMIFFDGEEAVRDWTRTDSLYGSRHLASKWDGMKVVHADGRVTSMLSGIELFVLLDLLGTPETQMWNLQAKTTWAWERLVDIEERLAKKDLLSASHSKSITDAGGNGGYFLAQTVNGNIEDDHKPFMERGVPIVHVIPARFPSVWHKASDNADAIKPEVVQNYARIFRVFCAEYLGLV